MVLKCCIFSIHINQNIKKFDGFYNKSNITISQLCENLYIAYQLLNDNIVSITHQDILILAKKQININTDIVNFCALTYCNSVKYPGYLLYGEYFFGLQVNLSILKDLRQYAADFLNLIYSPLVHDNINKTDLYTYSLYKRRNKQKNYAVKAYFNGQYDDDETYYTPDWDQAVRKINRLAKEKNLNLHIKKNMFIADSNLNITHYNVYDSLHDAKVRAILSKDRNNNYKYVITIDYFELNIRPDDDFDSDTEAYEFETMYDAFIAFEDIASFYNMYVTETYDAYIGRNY